MHVTLDTLIFGTGITLLTFFLAVVAFVAAFAISWVSYTVICTFPLYVMRAIKSADLFSVSRRDGRVMNYRKALVLLNLRHFSIVLVNARQYDETGK